MARIDKAELLLGKLKENPFVLAPMAGITDHAFRSFMRRLGASIVVTELVSANGIEYRSPRTIQLMSFAEEQRPVGIQLFGDDAQTLGEAAKFAQDQGSDFIDLNFGCPVPKVVKKGGGSAMLKDPAKLAQVLRAVVAAVNLPVTIKVRTGWDENSRNADEIANIAYNEGITWMAIHGRTRAQGYAGQSDWTYISEVKSRAKLPIIGNGDLVTAELAVQQLRQSGCDGVMIGRGCLKNPYIFSQSLALLNGAVNGPERDFVELFNDLKSELVVRCDEHIVSLQLKKFAAWFSTGYPNASHFRKNIFQSRSVDVIMDQVHNYFGNIKNIQQEDTSREAFLMGGHG